MDTTLASLAVPHGPLTVEDAAALQLEVACDSLGKVLPLGDEIVVNTKSGEKKVVKLQPLRQLFKGTAKAPDLSGEPTPELMPFFLLLEATVLRFCDRDGRDETDQEMERVYSQLRRRPDTIDSRLHSYLRAAARLYMSARDVSQDEYEAVMRRLAKSARTFSMQPISRNYLDTLRQTIGPSPREL